MWCLAVVVFVALRHLLQNAGGLAASLGDTDDATRLVQVRELLAGAPWFDMTLKQFGAPEVLFSHWSRLIDVPLAGLILLFRPFLGNEGAELATRIVWPLVVLYFTAYLVVREAHRRAGVWAGASAAALIVVTPTALYQFVPGRIDHHNVQILCVAGGLLLFFRAVSMPRVAPLTGLLLGLGQVVGYEALVLVAAAVAIAGLFAVFVPDLRAGTTRTIIWFAGTLAVCFVITTAPSRWFVPVCDALSLNLVVLAGAGAAAMGLLQRFASRAGWQVWLGGLAAGGIAGVAMFAAIDPVCLGGPMAQIDAGVKPIWLDHILEVQSLFGFIEQQPMIGFAYFTGAGIALAILAVSYWRSGSVLTLFALVILLTAIAYGCIFIRLIPYAVWLMIPVMAIWIAGLPAIGETSARTVRLGALVLTNQIVLLMVGNAFTTLLAGPDYAKATEPMIAGCEKRDGMRLVGQLPPGLVVADIDLGPHIAAHSVHRVMAAPYHRLDKSIIALDALFKSTPEKAERQLRALGADYVVLCAKGGDALRKRDTGSFEDTLRLGEPVPYLEPVPLPGITGPLRAWRLKPGH